MRIALVGPQGSGKTSIASALIEIIGGGCYSFAQGVRNEVAAALAANRPLDRSGFRVDTYLSAIYNDKAHFRPLLQAWGQFRRTEDPDYWINILFNNDAFSAGSELGEHVFIDDCRFANEYTRLRGIWFTFIRLEANPDIEQVNPTHESELDWPKFYVDQVLTFKPGPTVQAMRILEMIDHDDS